MAEHRVAVIGAGIAGLGAAHRLTARGFEVVLIERRGAPGGRARSQRTDGFTLEPGRALVSTHDDQLLAWIREIGLRDELLPLRPVIEARLDKGVVKEIDPRGWSGIARIPGIRPRQALRLVRLPRLLRRYADRLDVAKPGRAASLDDRSLGDFGRLYFGETALCHWMGPLVSASALGGEDETSRVLFLLEQHARAGARSGLLRGPLGDLIEAAARDLAPRCGMACESVSLKSDGSVCLQLGPGEGGRGGAGGRFDVDAVVIATSAPEARKIASAALTTAERDGLSEVRYAASVVLVVALRRTFSPHPQLIRIPATAGLPVESLLLEPGVSGGRVPEGRGLATLRATAAWSEAHFDAPEDVVEKDLLGAFEAIYPNARPAILFARAFRIPNALPRFDVGRYRQLARFDFIQQDQRRRGRRLYFAGDYLMSPSWEGALASGLGAAADVEADLGAIATDANSFR